MFLSLTGDVVPMLADLAPAVAVPDPAPAAPPGFDQLVTILSWIKNLALISAAAAFFGGLIVFAGGRILDHRRAGSTGAMMILSSLGAALLFGIGTLLLNAMASGAG